MARGAARGGHGGVSPSLATSRRFSPGSRDSETFIFPQQWRQPVHVLLFVAPPRSRDAARPSEGCARGREMRCAARTWPGEEKGERKPRKSSLKYGVNTRAVLPRGPSRRLFTIILPLFSGVPGAVAWGKGSRRVRDGLETR